MGVGSKLAWCLIHSEHSLPLMKAGGLSIFAVSVIWMGALCKFANKRLLKGRVWLKGINNENNGNTGKSLNFCNSKASFGNLDRYENEMQHGDLFTESIGVDGKEHCD